MIIRVYKWVMLSKQNKFLPWKLFEMIVILARKPKSGQYDFMHSMYMIIDHFDPTIVIQKYN